MNRTTYLPTNDLEIFAQLGIYSDLLVRARVKRVTGAEARQEFELTGPSDNAGMVFPYVDAGDVRRTCRLRRDHPEIKCRKVVRKYITPCGDSGRLYIVPGDHALGQDSSIPVAMVEAETQEAGENAGRRFAYGRSVWEVDQF